MAWAGGPRNLSANI